MEKKYNANPDYYFEVRCLNGDINERVFLKNRLYPGLAMSRSIGDLVGASAGVIAEPDVTKVNIAAQRDKFVILCSDGVWEFISSQEAVEMVARFDAEDAQQAAEKLASEVLTSTQCTSERLLNLMRIRRVITH